MKGVLFLFFNSWTDTDNHENLKYLIYYINNNYNKNNNLLLYIIVKKKVRRSCLVDSSLFYNVSLHIIKCITKYNTNSKPPVVYNKIITLYTYKLGTRGLQLRSIWTRFIRSQTGLYHIVTCVYSIICTYTGFYRTWLMSSS